MTVVLTEAGAEGGLALRLRPWRAEDAPSLAAAHRDPLLRRWLTAPLDSEAAARRWVAEQAEAWATGSRFSFAVVEWQEGGGCGSPVGHVVVKRAGPASRCAEVGYWTSSHVRGRGIAPRALDAVARWALTARRAQEGQAPLERLELLHAVDNRASCRVAHKSGFALDREVPPQPPEFPTSGHLHVRSRA
ncbi:GNAT family N-acetyltransferase [Streptomyces sp. ODS28]|uniref:GNAT family N-acetyltransferase n=1 Tax=Streptomyces sp. ODS28 TaxID=3136688 RepID=UPI0031ED40E3